MHTCLKRLFSFFLALVMCLSLLPVSALAEAAPAAAVTVEEPAVPEEPPLPSPEEEPWPAEEEPALPDPEAPGENAPAPDGEEPAEDEEPAPEPVSLEILTLPRQLWYQIGDSVDLTGIELSALLEDGSSVSITDPAKLEILSCDTSTVGSHEVVLGYGGLTVSFSIIVHRVYSHSMLLLDRETYPESEHNYSNSMNKEYPFTYSGADSLTLVFSAETMLENSYDKLYLSDGEGNPVGEPYYTGASLAGQTVVVPGDTVVIRLTSDSSVTYYGFSFDSITAELSYVEHEQTPPGIETPYTCFADAYTTYFCSACGEEVRVVHEGTAHHDFEGGFCVRCGVPENSLSSGALSDTMIWAILDDGTLYINGEGELPDNPAWDFSPDTITNLVVGSGVTRIGSSAFSGFTQLASVSLPDTLTAIGASAFSGCEALTGLTLPDGLALIDNLAFQKCTGLTALFLPASVETINASSYSRSPFYGCTANLTLYCEAPEKGSGWGNSWNYRSSGSQLITNYGSTREDCLFWSSADTAVESFSIPDGITVIPINAFKGKSSLKEVQIPASVKRIGHYAFQDCTALEALMLPEGLLEIGNYAFSNCKALTALDIPDSVERIGYRVLNGSTGVTAFTLPAALSSCGYSNGSSMLTGSSVSELFCAPGLTALPAYALYSVSSLTAVTLPDSLRSIGEYAFYGCSKLETVSMPQSLDAIGRYAFYNCSSLTEIAVPTGVGEIGEYTFSGCSKLEAVTLPESLTTLNRYAFYRCSSLPAVSLPEGVTEIGEYAFSGCSKLGAVTLPESLTTLNRYAFQDCGALAAVTLPEGLTSLGSYAFQNCTSLTEIVLPEGITAIPSYCFSGCTSLAAVTLPSGLSSLGSYAFQRCPLTQVSLPEALTSVGYCVFSGSTALEELTIPASVSSFGYSGSSGFLAGSSVQRVTFAESTRSVSSYALRGASSVQSVSLPETVGSIGTYSFAECTALQEITLPEGVTSVGNYAFQNCRSLETITVPAGQQVGNYAYANCSGALDLTVGDNAVIGSYAFSGCTGLRYLQLGENVKLGENAFKGAVVSGTCGESATWSLDMETGTLSIGGYYLMTDYSPESPAPWYSVRKMVKELAIADTVDGIGAWAFAGCENLESVVLPDGLQFVGDNAFYGCSCMQYLEIPDGLQSIGDAAFDGCTALEQAVFLGDAPAIGEGSFASSLLQFFYPETGSGYTQRLFSRFGQNAWILFDDTVPTKDVVILLDTSGSMSGKTDTLSAAATEFIASVGGAMKRTRVSVVRYDSSPYTLTGFTTDPVVLKKSVASLRADGGTEYYRALNHANNLLADSKADIRFVVMFSDGEPNDSTSSIYSLAETMQLTTEMYTVGLLSSESQRDVLINVAGSETRYFEATDIQELVAAFVALSENFGKSEETTAVIKRHGVRYDLLAEEQELCLNSDEMVTIYITPGTAEKYRRVDSIAIRQNGKILLQNKTGIFEAILPGSYFVMDYPVYSVLFDNSGHVLEEKQLLLSFRDRYTVSYRWDGSGPDRYRVYRTDTFLSGNDIKEPPTPTKTGYVFRGWYASPSYDGLPFFHLVNFFNRAAVNGDLTLYAKWEKNSFRMGYNTWPFLNSYKNFRSDDYEISTRDYNKLIQDLSNSTKQYVQQKKDKKWGGSCFGMSTSAVLGTTGVLDISNFDPSSTYFNNTYIYYNKYGDTDVGNIESMINFYHLRQYFGTVGTITYTYNASDESANLPGIIRKMETTGEPVALNLSFYKRGWAIFGGGQQAGGHSVVAFNLSKTDNGYTFKVYDCSKSEKDSYTVTVTITDGVYSKACKSWEDDWGYDILLESALTSDDITSMPYLVAPNTVRSASTEAAAAQTSLTASYNSFTISDGTRSAVIVDGSVVSGDLPVGCYGNISEIGYDPEYLFALPSLPAGGQFTITQSGAGVFETVCRGEGFFVTQSAAVPGTLVISADGSVRTSYAAEAQQSISVCTDAMTTPWYNVEISGSSTGFTVTPGSETVSVVPGTDTTVDISANSDFNELMLKDVPVSAGGVTVEEGEDDVCEVRDSENVLAAQGLYGFSVAFDSQLGSPVATLYNVPAGALLAEPEDPVREGFLFEGWFKDEACTLPWNFETDTVTADTILYAGWSVNPNYLVAVTFRVPGQEDETIYLPKRTLIPASAAPTAPDGTAYLWYAHADYSGEPWNFDEDIAADNMTLYGKTSLCRISFETGVDQTLPALDAYYGLPIGEPTGLQREGWTLCGWYTDSAFTTPWNFETDLVTEDMTLYAHWLENIRDKNGADTGICVEIVNESGLIYTGKPIQPTVLVRDDGRILTAGKDYSLSFKNNTNACSQDDPAVKDAKKPQVIVQGKGDYKSAKKITVYFSILQAELSEQSISLPALVAVKPKDKLQALKPTVKTEKITVPAAAYTVRYYADEALTESVKGITAAGTYYLVLEAKNSSGIYTGNFCGAAGPFAVTAVEAGKLLSSAAKITLPKTVLALDELPGEDAAIRALIAKVTVGKESFQPDEAGLETFKACFEVAGVDTDGAVLPQSELGQLLLSCGAKTVIIRAREGNERGFVGEKSVKVTVKGRALKKADFFVSFVSDGKAVLKSEYGGFNQVPEVSSELIEGQDYTVSYRSGKQTLSPVQVRKAGSYTLVITGKGAYTGTLNYAFSITKVNLAAAYAAGRLQIRMIGEATQSLGGAKPAFSISYINADGRRIQLAESADYSLKYAKNTTANTGASATLSGKGSFTGSLSKAKAPELGFEIGPKDLSSPEITVSVDGLSYKNGAVSGVKFSVYDGSKKLPAKEYTSSFTVEDESILLTIAAKELNYTGVRLVTVHSTLVKTGDTKKVKISIPGGNKYYFTGKAIEPPVEILDAEGNDISDCFTVLYGKNTRVGSGTIQIIGRPELGYYGSRTLKFTILAKWLQWLLS